MGDKEYQGKARGLLFNIEKSVRYHNRRKRFFVYMHNWATFLAAIMGTATFTTVFAETGRGIELTFAALVAVFSIADLIIASPSKAREYEDLVRRFIEVQKKILMLKEKTVEQLAIIEMDMLDIEADEPPVLRTLNAICHNEAIIAMGLNPKAVIKIGWFQRLFRHFWDLNPEKI